MLWVFLKIIGRCFIFGLGGCIGLAICSLNVGALNLQETVVQYSSRVGLFLGFDVSKPQFD